MAREIVAIEAEPEFVQNIGANGPHIADDSVAQADRWVDMLDEKFALWATLPMMERSLDELAPGIRSFVFGRYVVYFEPLPAGIDVVRVLHGSPPLARLDFGEIA